MDTLMIDQLERMRQTAMEHLHTAPVGSQEEALLFNVAISAGNLIAVLKRKCKLDEAMQHLRTHMGRHGPN